MGAAPFKREVSELVDDQQFRLAVKQQALGELVFGARRCADLRPIVWLLNDRFRPRVFHQ